jgi:hypothetical protein
MTPTHAASTPDHSRKGDACSGVAPVPGLNDSDEFGGTPCYPDASGARRRQFVTTQQVLHAPRSEWHMLVDHGTYIVDIDEVAGNLVERLRLEYGHGQYLAEESQGTERYAQTPDVEASLHARLVKMVVSDGLAVPSCSGLASSRSEYSRMMLHHRLKSSASIHR